MLTLEWMQREKAQTLQFRTRELVWLVESAGVCQSYILRCLGGLDCLGSAHLQVDDASTDKWSDEEWAQYRNQSVGYIDSENGLIADQSVLHNVELPLALAHVAAKKRTRRAIEVLRWVGLSGLLDSMPAELTQEQLMRAAIARALVNEPKLILAAEPTRFLDAQGTKLILSLLHELAQNRLVVISTCRESLAAEASGRIVHLSGGEIISDSNPSYLNVVSLTATPKRVIHRPLSIGSVLSLLSKPLGHRAVFNVVASGVALTGAFVLSALESGRSAVFTVCLLMISALTAALGVYHCVQARTGQLSILQGLGATRKDFTRVLGLDALFITLLSGGLAAAGFLFLSAWNLAPASGSVYWVGIGLMCVNGNIVARIATHKVATTKL